MGRQSTRQAQKRREAKRHRRNHPARANARGQVVRAASKDAHWRFDADAGAGLSNHILGIATAWLDDAPEDLAPVIVKFAVICWNLAVLEVKAADPQLGRYIDRGFRIDPRDLPAITHYCRQMVARKHALYPDDQRFVVTHEVSGEGPETRLAVVGTFLPEASEEQRQAALAHWLEPLDTDEAPDAGPATCSNRMRTATSDSDDDAERHIHGWGAQR
jgi:hypothetical protein